jgi:hypothetical protein
VAQNLPLNAFGKLYPQIPIIELFEHLFNDIYDDDWLEFVGRVFIMSNSITQEDKIIALELTYAMLLMELHFSFIRRLSVHPSGTGTAVLEKHCCSSFLPTTFHLNVHLFRSIHLFLICIFPSWPFFTYFQTLLFWV